MLALGVGGWAYLVTGVSLLIVRQIPAHDAFRAAPGKEAIYLPAALAGLAGALAGRARRSDHPRSPLVLSQFVAAVGLLGVLDAVLPNDRRALIALLAPERVHGIGFALVAPLGLALLVTARGLARRKRRAWQIAVVLLSGLVALHLQHRFGYGAIVTGLVAVALLARRGDFDAPGDPTAHPRILVHALLFAAAIFGYAFGTLSTASSPTSRTPRPSPSRRPCALSAGSMSVARRTSPEASASGSRCRCSCSRSSPPASCCSSGLGLGATVTRRRHASAS